MSTPLRIGIVGANFGSDIARGFATLQNARLVAVADPEASRRSKLAKELGIDSQFETGEELITQSELDAVVIASPTFLHARHIAAAFDAGLHALCASPVGVNSREASHAVTSAGLVGKTFMVSNPLRFDPRIGEARKIVASQELGEILHASVCIQISDWPHAPGSWRLDRERGGGAVLAAGLQALDALWYAIDCPEPMEALAASYDHFSRQRADSSFELIAEDLLAGTTRFKNGSSLQFTAQINAPLGGERQRLSLHVYGTLGSLDAVNGVYCPAGASKPRRYGDPADAATCHASEAKAFLHSIEAQEEPPATGRQALALSKMTDALLESGREKEAIAIKVERNLDDLFGAL